MNDEDEGVGILDPLGGGSTVVNDEDEGVGILAPPPLGEGVQS